ncbi:MAG: alpha/beta fold hydrolase [Myxococcales bacterium]|nr:alpha/beta fold hydrolase [Myxococcales bacterium]MCB9629152.1 alpha/beta fold hydrolase [Sandaracinaceae bacterium]
MRRTATRPRIAYDTHGDSGSNVLLIMGLGMRGEVWAPQVAALAKQHCVATYDHRGVGASEPSPTALWTMKDMARDAARVMDDLGWERAHLVGVSMGGMVAQELALLHPTRFMSLTLIATQAGGPTGWTPPPDGLVNFLRSFAGGGGRLAALQQLLYPPEFVASMDAEKMQQQLALRFGKPAPRATIVGQVSAVMRHDTRSRLVRLRLPCLVVRPGKDRLVHPSRSEDLARLIPGAELVSLDDAGHGVTFQCAEALNALLLSHFAMAEGLAVGAHAPSVWN